ncbi:MAG: 30S ribosomal protein S11 [Verrucomicrobiaceae bacterium]|jgi:small subunit ribosomal protein S11|nr:30S ribosomal protein S11 [Verrucomicrobiaceae bacterium]
MSEEEIKDDAAETPAAEEAKAPEAAEKAPAEAPAADTQEAAPQAEDAAAEDAPKAPEKKRDIFAEIAGGEEEQIRIHKAKKSKNVQTGLVHITATFNNTLVSVTDVNGNAIGWSSAGKMGFKGSRKSTAYAAQVVCQDACRQAMSHGLKEAEVRVKGPGSGRESAVRAVQGLGINITAIRDVTPIPHNGCRPKKARRV